MKQKRKKTKKQMKRKRRNAWGGRRRNLKHWPPNFDKQQEQRQKGKKSRFIKIDSNLFRSATLGEKEVKDEKKKTTNKKK